MFARLFSRDPVCAAFNRYRKLAQKQGKDGFLSDTVEEGSFEESVGSK